MPIFCEPPATEPCYDGDPATEGVGACRAGTRTCLEDGGAFGNCEDQVLPGREICGNAIDDDCDHAVDEPEDEDGDGFSTCDDDCCDRAGDCATPALVNPGPTRS
jgi:hypothetical protein